MVTRPSARTALELLAVGLSVFAASYGLLKSSGLFTIQSGELIRALHERPPQIALALLLLASGARMLLPEAKGGRGLMLLFWSGVAAMAAGLIISSFVRFEGRVILTEGQHFTGASEEFAGGSVYAAPRAALPQFRLIAQTVEARLSANGRVADRVTMRAVYQGGPAQFEDIAIGSWLPSLRQGVLFRVTGFGYSPGYQVADAARGPFEGGIVSMAIFPPGAEDAIRSWDIPHTFYLQYFPDGIAGKREEAGTEPDIPGPVFRLRIMRNLDTSFSGVVRLQEPVPVDGMVFTIEELRRWAELSVVKDYGMLLFLAGAVLCAASIGISYGRSRAGGRRPASASGGTTP